MGRGVPLGGIGDLPGEVNSAGSGKKSETEDWLEFYADGELVGVDLSHGAVQRGFPLEADENPRGDQPINSEAGQETSIEGVVPADTRTRVAVIEAPDRSAEQGIWQEGANGISGARPDGRQKDASRFLITA